MTLMSILLKGGWTMIAIGISLFIGIYFAIDRFIYFRRARTHADDILRKVRAYLSDNDPGEAIREIGNYDTPITRIIVKGLMSGSIQSIDAQTADEVKKFENGLGIIASIGAIAPMLGFFGTVLGMIKAFMQIEILGGGVNPSRLAGGIWEALVTTAAGLAVGIVFLLIYNHFSDKLSDFINDTKRIKAELSVLMGN